MRGVPSRQLVRMAIAYWGVQQIEVCQPLDDEPSLWREFLDEHPSGGLQHLAWMVEDYDAAIGEVERRGWRLGQEAVIGDERLAYYEPPIGHPGTTAEIVDLTARRRRLFDMVRDAATTWDGMTSPVRQL